ncbi:MAG TPA: TPM domain-containing protein [Pyrinomonadaceae bacterium]|jgi:uncharacterized protein|nr:TPM domain-containing protein [Pyrinomonadaceae bacterium]
MNLTRALAAVLCLSSALCAAGCASPPSTSNNARPAAEEKVQSPLPAPTGFVNDYAKAIGAETRAALEAKLTRLKASANVELAVVTVETTGGQDISDYSLAVAKGWGIGPPTGEEGGGVLLLVAVGDRQWRIQVARRLEADLPNEATAEIGKLMTPHLREGDYEAAVRACVEGLVRRLAARRGFDADEVLKD